MLKNKSDSELISIISTGNYIAFEELISRYEEKAFALATRLTRNQEDAEEVLQDVFTTVFRKIKGFEGKSSFSSWLYRVTVNASLMKLRKRRQDRSVHLEDILLQSNGTNYIRTPENQEVDHEVFLKQLREVLQLSITNLPDEYRKVFVLRDIDGLSSAEVSKILKISIPAVKSRLHRSRLLLRRRLAQLYRDSIKNLKSGQNAGNM